MPVKGQRVINCHISVSHFPLELVHSDIWGPACDSINAKKFYVSFLMIITSPHGITSFSLNLKSFKNFMTFRSLLNDSLIGKL